MSEASRNTQRPRPIIMVLIEIGECYGIGQKLANSIALDKNGRTSWHWQKQIYRKMSGVSLAVAPRSEPDQPADTAAVQRRQQEASLGGVMGSLRVIELQLVAFIMVFSASGLVPLLDLIFPAFASAYLLVLSRFAFPSLGKTNESPEIFQGSRLFRFYVIVGTSVGLFLPLAYVLGGFARGDDHAVRSATPHLFLLSFQILTENIISGLSLFSPPVRALVPLLYTVRRVFVVIDWMKDVWVNKTLPANAEFKDVGWYWFGRGLAVANLAYFAVNLFCFLIPRFLPRAFEIYFMERDEMHAKMAEDKRSAALNNPQTSDKKAD
ncbi:hypothetical protein BUALT_Bualt17G0015500 [Buddleja alternifolia]|uniref:DUF7733 domain-containing protein n=1 Tax=Buddleja alternifolia TaxID=168488 RepID=A0AAV6WBN9_9LAMI|nr:hypothetical protein BUALT_Bualt17G0015500 [Buddleja alternifolia]